MSDKPYRSEDRKDNLQRRLRLLTPALIGAALCFGAGSMFQQRVDEKAAAKLALEINADRQRERDTAVQREQHLESLLAVQRRDAKHDSEDRHRHLVAFTANAGRVRNQLQAQLAESERSGDACQRGAAGVAEAAGELLDLAGEGDGLLQEAARENERLATENRKLFTQVTRWQQHYRDGQQVITVTAQRGPH